MKLIGYARVSTKQQSTDRQEIDLLAAGVRHDGLYIDRGVSGARASRPQFDRAIGALIEGDVLVITTLDRLGRSTQNMLAFAHELRNRGAGLRVLKLGGDNVDTSTPTGSMLFTIMAALAEMEHQIKRERVTDSVAKRRAAGQDLGGRPRLITDSQIRNALRLIAAGSPPRRSHATYTCPGPPCTDGRKTSAPMRGRSSVISSTPTCKGVRSSTAERSLWTQRGDSRASPSRTAA